MIKLIDSNAPIVPLVTSDEAIAHMRLASAVGETAFIEALVSSATEFIEEATGRTLSVRVRSFEITNEYRDEQLLYGPLYTGTEAVDDPVMESVDEEGVHTTVTVSSEFLRRGLIRHIELGNVGDVFILTLALGPTVANPVAKQACLLLVGHWYEHREAVDDGRALNEVPMTAQRLIAQLRRPTVA